MKLAPLRLKKDEDRRLRIGHLWVFSNEVDVDKTPLSAFNPGDPVVIESSSGKPLGSGYINPNALLCARIVSRRADRVLDQAMLQRRIEQALALRQMLFPEPYYRLVFGEADWLPGLVVDRYGDVLVAQITTAGMERAKAEIIRALQAVVNPSALVLRNDSASRALEGLASYVETIGEAPEHDGDLRERPALRGAARLGAEDRLVLRPEAEPGAHAAVRARPPGAGRVQLYRCLGHTSRCCRRSRGAVPGQLRQGARAVGAQCSAERRGRRRYARCRAMRFPR